MRGARKIRRTAFGAQACQINMLYLQALNTCFTFLRGTQPCHRLHLPPSCWSHVGVIFRPWAFLGRILRFLLRLLSLSHDFCASWGAPGSILEGSGLVLEGFLVGFLG